MTSNRSSVGRSLYNELKYITEEYKNGVDSFLKYSCDNHKDEDEGLMRCPCQKCNGIFMGLCNGIPNRIYTGIRICPELKLE